MRRRRSVAVLAGALAWALAACDVQTATAPAGDLTIYATFDDVQDLTRGHYVQMSDVVVGSVGALELDGHRARVRLDVDGDREVPVGTRAVVRRTSLLGEHFVDLVLPEDYAPGERPVLADGDEIGDTASQLELEELAARAGAVVEAIDAGALAATVDAGDRALGGRGQQLHGVIAKASEVVGVLRSQQDALVGTVDALASAGEQFATRADDLVALIDAAERATATAAGSRDRAVAAARAVTELARATNEQVFAPHTERIDRMLAEANPVLQALSARADTISGLFDDILFFNSVLPDVVANGQVLIQAWLDPFVLLGGQESVDVSDPAALLVTVLNGVL